MLKRLLIIALALAIAGAAGSGSAAPRGDWVGTYSVGKAYKVDVTVASRGVRAAVALGVGHADAQTVDGSLDRRSASASRCRAGRRLRSTGGCGRRRHRDDAAGLGARSFALRRGSGAALFARGFFGSGAPRWALVDDPYGPARADELERRARCTASTETARFQLGSGWSTRRSGLRRRALRRRRWDSCGDGLRPASGCGSTRCASRAAMRCSPARSLFPAAPAGTRRSRSSAARAGRSAPTCPTSRRCWSTRWRGRARLRQARHRAVVRPLPGRVSDERHDRPARPRRRRQPRAGSPRSPTWMRRGRDCRPQPGGLDHAARRVAGGRRPLHGRLLRAGRHRRRERHMAEPRR